MKGIIKAISYTILLSPLISLASPWLADKEFLFNEYTEENFGLDRNMERFTVLAQLKINLNIADTRELMEIPGIGFSKAVEIIDLRKRIGSFTSYRDLLIIPQIDVYDIIMIKKFTYIQSEISTTNESLQTFDLLSLDKTINNNNDSYLTNRTNPQSLLEIETKNSHGYEIRGFASERPIYSAQYDNNSGLIYEDNDIHWQAERISLSKSLNGRSAANTKWVFGNYNMGFAEGLTINSGLQRHLNGVYPFTPYHIKLFNGEILERPALLGMAIQHATQGTSAKIGYALFASSNTIDLGKKEFTYGPNPNMENTIGSCAKPGNHKNGFICFPDGIWRSWSVIDSNDSSSYLKTIGIEDALHETMFGQHVNVEFPNHRLGLIHYESKIDTMIDAPAFSVSPYSRYPVTQELSSTGVYYQYFGANYVSTEISLDHETDISSIIRWQTKIFKSSELSISARNLNSAHYNPHSNTESASDFVAIPWPRNEQGARVKFDTRFGSLKYSSIIDIWYYTDTLDSHGIWTKAVKPQQRGYARQLITIPIATQDISSAHHISIGTDWADQDMRVNGRNESFLGQPDNIHGQRRRLLVDFRSDTSFLKMRWRYLNTWIDTQPNKQDFSTQKMLAADFKIRLASVGILQFAQARTIRALSESESAAEDQPAIFNQTMVGLNLRARHKLMANLAWSRIKGRIFDSAQLTNNFQTWNTILLELSYTD